MIRLAGLVIQGVFYIIALRPLLYISAHLNIQDHSLSGAAFPVIYADNGIDTEVFKINYIHAIGSGNLRVVSCCLFRCRYLYTSS